MIYCRIVTFFISRVEWGKYAPHWVIPTDPGYNV